MKRAYLKALRRRLIIKYACIIIGITLGTITLIYLFDDVLNGVVIDFIRLFMETGDPFLRRGSMTFLTGSNVPKMRTRAKM